MNTIITLSVLFLFIIIFSVKIYQMEKRIKQRVPKEIKKPSPQPPHGTELDEDERSDDR